MNLSLPLSEDQRDCLQEVSNVAMGAAAESLSEITNLFVHLPIPAIRYVEAQNVLTHYEHLEQNRPLSIISQGCNIGDLDCQVLFFISDINLQDLLQSTEIAGHTQGDHHDLLMILFEAISNTCFIRLAEMFEANITRHQASVKARHILPSAIDLSVETEGQPTVTVEINYQVESHPFNCHLLLLFPQKALGNLTASLNQLLH